MKSYIDQRKVSRRALFANIASIGGMILLLVSILFPLYRPLASGPALIMMAAGLGIAMVGIYFANRWVRKPRPETVLDHVLKSLNDSYKIYHYPALPCDHILLTPNGTFVLETVSLSGSFSYKNGHWKEKMTLGRALRMLLKNTWGIQLNQPAARRSSLTINLAAEWMKRASCRYSRWLCLRTLPQCWNLTTRPFQW